MRRGSLIAKYFEGRDYDDAYGRHAWGGRRPRHWSQYFETKSNKAKIVSIFLSHTRAPSLRLPINLQNARRDTGRGRVRLRPAVCRHGRAADRPADGLGRRHRGFPPGGVQVARRAAGEVDGGRLRVPEPRGRGAAHRHQPPASGRSRRRGGGGRVVAGEHHPDPTSRRRRRRARPAIQMA